MHTYIYARIQIVACTDTYIDIKLHTCPAHTYEIKEHPGTCAAT